MTRVFGQYGFNCEVLWQGDEGGSVTRIVNFIHDSVGFSVQVSRNYMLAEETSHGTITAGPGIMDTVEGLPDNTEITLTGHDGDEFVFSFNGDEVTVVRWTRVAVVDPSSVTVEGACLARGQDMTELRLTLYLEGAGLSSTGARLVYDISADTDLGAQPFTDMSTTIDPTGLARDQLIFTQDTDFATLTFDSFDLETQDAQGALVVTDILDLVTAALGQQDELDANGDPTGNLLPLGTYQYTWHAHGANSTIVGDCDSPFLP